MIFLRAAENRKIRGICPCPAIREGDTRVGVLRVSGRTNRVYARPAAGFPRCRCFPNISIIALSAPKEKGFPSLLLCFAADGGKMLFSVKALQFCNDKNQVTGVWTAKVSKGRSQSPLIAAADAKPSAQQKSSSRMGVHCEGVEGATAKPPRRVRRREIPCTTKKCSWFSLQNQMNSNEIKRNQISLTNIHSPYYNITVAIAANKIRKE